MSAAAAKLAQAPAGSGRPGVFLDKDGTVLEDVPYNVDPAQMRLAPGAAEGLALLAGLGCPLVVVSNQPGVGEGRFDERALSAVFGRLHELFLGCGAELRGFVYCPHAAGTDGMPACTCRKPEPGLLYAAAARFDLALERSWMIGDILDDVEAGVRAGCRTVLLDNGHETEWRVTPLRRSHYSAGDLAGAARIVRSAWHTKVLP
ncbi:MAG: HAD-IIIA family hydrolase [Pseudomonadota bacterium]